MLLRTIGYFAPLPPFRTTQINIHGLGAGSTSDPPSLVSAEALISPRFPLRFRRPIRKP